MEIYTSYWWQVRNFPPNLVGLNTVMFPPKYRPFGEDNRGVIVINCPPIVPNGSCTGLCDGSCLTKRKDCKFLQTYRAQLDKIDFSSFLNSINKLAEKIKKDKNIEDVDFALIVFEAPTRECSERYPLQEWLRAHGFKGEEWKPNN